MTTGEFVTFTESQKLIVEECDTLKEMLFTKNRLYGDSALNPRRIFSKSSPVEQILVRIDDRVSRWLNQQSDDTEDIVLDLLGYFVLLRVATRLSRVK